MRSVKRALSLLLLLCMFLSLVACGTKPETPGNSIPTTTTSPTTPEKQTGIVNVEGMTDLQKAVVLTAESYLNRGKYAQYDQYNLTSKSSNGVQNVGRRLVGMKAPEDYTAQNYGYTDCSGFVYDLYYFALGMPLTNGERNTKAFCSGSEHTILSEQPEKDKFSELSKEELAAKEAEFLETLQPGDIIVYRTAGNKSGHAMLYVGNKMMIHSTGSTYDFSAGADKVEKNGTYYYDSINALLTPGNRRYLFDKHIYIIMRPLNNFNGEIPASTRQRLDLMRGVVAEKLSSHTYGQTVNPGDTMTFTFRIKNVSNVHKELTITDTLSPYLTYVSGAQTVNGSNLSWNVTVQSGQTLEVNYTVKVSESAPLGDYVVSNSVISGIAVNCPRVKIAKTLTAEQQTAITAALKELEGGSVKGIELINAIYEKALGKTLFAQQTTDEIWADLVKKWTRDYALDTSLPLYNTIAPCLYGGQNLCEIDASAPIAKERTRLVTNQVLVVGDVVLADDRLYLFTGLGLYDLMTNTPGGLKRPESLLAAKRFVVLRSSMTF